MFPVALFLIVAMGSELVTGNIMYFTVALLERKYVHIVFASSLLVSLTGIIYTVEVPCGMSTSRLVILESYRHIISFLTDGTGPSPPAQHQSFTLCSTEVV